MIESKEEQSGGTIDRPFIHNVPLMLWLQGFSLHKMKIVFIGI